MSVNTDNLPYDFDTKKIELAALLERLNDPSLINNQQEYIKVTSQYNETKELVDTWQELLRLEQQTAEAEALSTEDGFEEIANAELTKLSEPLAKITTKFKALTTPKLPDDEKPAIMEFRAGTGGVEASLFTEEVLRMYLRYLSSLNFPVEEISTSYQAEGGIKEAVIAINQPGAFGKLRFESGVHRVQRVPSTESGGRIHTSAISLAVLPQIETSELEIDESEIKLEVFRASGPGGQSVNTTDSAVRITHIPTGITVSCQDGKSQHKNKEKALKVLASKLYEIQQEEIQAAAQQIRTAAVKSGDRSAKIRTYNFPQGRITDHRTKDSWLNLPIVLDGDLSNVVPVVNQKLRMID